MIYVEPRLLHENWEYRLCDVQRLLDYERKENLRRRRGIAYL